MTIKYIDPENLCPVTITPSKGGYVEQGLLGSICVKHIDKRIREDTWLAIGVLHCSVDVFWLSGSSVYRRGEETPRGLDFYNNSYPEYVLDYWRINSKRIDGKIKIDLIPSSGFSGISIKKIESDWRWRKAITNMILNGWIYLPKERHEALWVFANHLDKNGYKVPDSFNGAVGLLREGKWNIALMIYDSHLLSLEEEVLFGSYIEESYFNKTKENNLFINSFTKNSERILNSLLKNKTPVMVAETVIAKHSDLIKYNRWRMHAFLNRQNHLLGIMLCISWREVYTTYIEPRGGIINETEVYSEDHSYILNKISLAIQMLFGD